MTGLSKPRLVRLLAVSMAIVFFVYVSDSLFLSNATLSFSLQPPLGPFHFCQVHTLETGAGHNPLELPHQCAGPEYDTFAKALHAFAPHNPHVEPTWGRRLQVAPTHSRTLILGNADTQQIAYSLACQYQGVVHTINEHTEALHFADYNATIVLVTDAGDGMRNHSDFAAAVERNTGYALSDTFHAVIWGLLHDCGIRADGCPNTTARLYWDAALHRIPDVPMLFIGMMADARADQSLAIRDAIRAHKHKGPRKLWFISGRRYIGQHFHNLEGATIYGKGMDADNAPKTGKIGHRCMGDEGGHSDLIAWDVTEFLFQQLGFNALVKK